MKNVLQTGYKILAVALLAYVLIYGLTVTVPAMPGLDPGNPFEKAVTDAAEALASVAPIGPNGHPGPSILRHDERT